MLSLAVFAGLQRAMRAVLQKADHDLEIADDVENIAPAGDIREGLNLTGAETATRVGNGCLGIEALIDQFEQADAPGVGVGCRASSSSDASFSTSCRDVFTRSDTTGFGTPRSETSSDRAWVLLILATPADTAQPRRMTGFSEALSPLTELTDRALDQVADRNMALPPCPHCGSCHTCFLG